MGYTGEQVGVIIGGMVVILVVLICMGKNYVDRITKK